MIQASLFRSYSRSINTVKSLLFSFPVIDKILFRDLVHRVPKLGLVERLWFIELVSVDSSNHVSVQILFWNPGSSIKKCHCSSKSTCWFLHYFASIHSSHWVIESAISRGNSLPIIRPLSKSRILESFTSCCAYGNLLQTRMSSWNGLFAKLMWNCS